MTRLKVPSLATFAEVAGTAGPLRPGGPMLALITTDQTVTAADLVARYAASWAIEVTFFDTRQILGVGQARNRTAQAHVGLRDVRLHHRRHLVHGIRPPVPDRRRPPYPRAVVSV
jgi:hypothetical protein